MRPTLLAAAALLLGACAPATTTAEDRRSMGAPSINETDEVTDGTVITIRTEAHAIRNKVPAPPERAFAAVEQVYADIGIPVTARDPATKTLGNPRFSATRRLSGARLTEYFDCGNNRGIPNADTYTIRMDIRSTVTPDADGSVVSTVIQATARSNDGASSAPVPCRTLTRLEERISVLTAAKVLAQP